jgi:hypothetical protein
MDAASQRGANHSGEQSRQLPRRADGVSSIGRTVVNRGGDRTRELAGSGVLLRGGAGDQAKGRNDPKGGHSPIDDSCAENANSPPKIRLFPWP